MFFITMDGFILVTVTFSKKGKIDDSSSKRFSSTAIARGILKDNKI